MTESTASRDRMIVAAAALFARAGFNGVTTRDIAQSANVSEGNIFRYFSSKRDLFMAAIDYELGKLQVRAQALDASGEADDSPTALRKLFEMITRTVVDEPGLVRLLHFSVLEFGAEMEPLYRKHLDGVAAASAGNLHQWLRTLEARNVSARLALLSFVATVALLQLYPVLTASDLPYPSVESAAAAHAELWYRVLCDGSASARGSGAEDSAGTLGN